MLLPAFAAAGPVLTTETSAVAATVAVVVDVSFAVVESFVVVDTSAVLTMLVPSGTEGATFTTYSNVATASGASNAIVHVIVPTQLNVGPLVCVDETNVVFVGTVSVSVTSAASEGPLFVTVMV
jgi:hypothetical protein